MKYIVLKNSGYPAKRVVLIYDRYTWDFESLNRFFGGIISFRIIKINKT